MSESNPPRLTMRSIMDHYLKPSTSQETFEAPMISGKFFALIRNIPSGFRSAHLRAFFSNFIENSRFDCFHFKHRPEIQKRENDEKTNTFCCVVRFAKAEDREEFIKDYHKENWIDFNRPNLRIARRCFITPIKVINTKPTTLLNESEAEDCQLSATDLLQMIELRPPEAMPKGNVGTPTEYFFEQISLCKLPPSIITKLGLKRLRRRRKFGAVPFQYGNKSRNAPGTSRSGVKFGPDKEREEESTSENEEALPTDEEADDDDDQCEEWERHEALYDDVTEQDRTKQKKYEEEMEVVWEKGGPGLVWNMDKEYWDEREKGTDCDWLWADDWDVDYSVYYEGKSAGDIDSKQAVEIREDEGRRTGSLAESVFRKPSEKSKTRKRRYSGSDVVDVEQYTKRVGSRLMKRMGWMPGVGLGSSGREGKVIPVALDMGEKALIGGERTGLGFRGEKMSRTGNREPKRHHLLTAYDTYKDKDESRDKMRRLVGDNNELTSEVLWRRKEPTYLKHY